jgi:ectoine hydroxylase-related dioxygenase (phytanoyl-CoA dioxygenase family)
MVYRNLIQADAITALGKTLEDFATQKAPTNTWLRYDDGPLFDRVENFIPFLNPDMREHLSSPVISNLLETCFGNPVVLLKDKCNFKPPGKSDFPLHQDAAAGWEKSGYGKKHITLAISLDDVSLDNGAVRFALGKHQEGLFSSLYEVMDPNYLQQWDFYPLAMSPGDAVIFDSYTPHYSTANLSQQSRKMLFLTYIDASYADLASQFFPEKRLRQPPMDERDDNTPLVRNEYGKWIRKTE